MSIEACSLCHAPLFVTHIKIIFMYIKQKETWIKVPQNIQNVKNFVICGFFQGFLVLTKYLSAYSVQSV